MLRVNAGTAPITLDPQHYQIAHLQSPNIAHDTALQDLFMQSGGLDPALQRFILQGKQSAPLDTQALYRQLFGAPSLPGRDLGTLNAAQGWSDTKPAEPWPTSPAVTAPNAQQSAELAKQIMALFKLLEQMGLEYAARPDSQMSGAVGGGDFSGISPEDLLAFLTSQSNHANRNRDYQAPAAGAFSQPGASKPGDPQLINQGDFTNALPGGKSVAGVGCMACSFIMAANGLNGTNMRPDAGTINKMNANGGFQGNLLVRGPAASALGMKQQTMHNAQDLAKHLENGGMAVIPVKGEGHWVTLRMGENGQIEALDPAGGVKKGVSIQGNQIVVEGYSPGVQEYIALSPA